MSGIKAGDVIKMTGQKATNKQWVAYRDYNSDIQMLSSSGFAHEHFTHTEEWFNQELDSGVMEVVCNILPMLQLIKERTSEV